MDLLSSFSIRGWNPSGPADLDIFNFKSFFSTISGVITMSVRLTLYGRSFMVGILTVSSLVNTLAKYLFSSSAFSWSSLVSWPWSVIMSPNPVLFLSFDLQYLQKSFGFSLRLSASFRSNFRHKFRVKVVKSFFSNVARIYSPCDHLIGDNISMLVASSCASLWPPSSSKCFVVCPSWELISVCVALSARSVSKKIGTMRRLLSVCPDVNPNLVRVGVRSSLGSLLCEVLLLSGVVTSHVVHMS